MRQAVRKAVNVLDGKPGQSLVEMAFTFPLLILMVLSLVEVGFLANNYLILMDAVRAAGRSAVNLDPTAWNESFTRNQNHMDCDTMDPGLGADKHEDSFYMFGQVANPPNDTRTTPRGKHLEALKDAYTKGPEGSFGFFDEIACQVIHGMTPLLLNDTDNATSKDDVVVSAISYRLVDYGSAPTPGDPQKYAKEPGARGNTWATVTGRWPLKNRYCGLYNGPNSVGDERDPFDWQRSAFNGSWKDGLADGNEAVADESALLKQNPSDNQQVRGFVFTGNSVNDDNSGCYGSKFTVQEIEARMNLDDAAFNKEVPNGGMVIIEVFWQHHPLVLGPIFQGFTGSRLNDPVLWVWGWFPVPGAEPTPTSPAGS
jgi:TadE-like protein